MGNVTSIALTSDSKYIVSASTDKTIRLWNFHEKTQESILYDHTEWIRCVVITRDNKYIISGGDKTVRIWNLKDKTEEAVFWKAILILLLQ